jgi:hypothetical protein
LNKIIENIPVIKDDINYWLIKTSNGKYYQQFIKDHLIKLYNFTNLNEIGTKKAPQMNQFINVMKENDIVIIPSHLKKYISIGVITSKFENQYRHVSWIKEISFTDLDSKCHKYFFKDETIICLNDVASYLERLIYALYLKNDKYYFSIKVNQKSNILFKSIYGLYRLFLDDENDDNLEIKINLQSPGIIEFISKNLEVIIVIIKIVQIISTLKNRKVDDVNIKLVDKYFKYEIDKLEIDAPEINLEKVDK